MAAATASCNSLHQTLTHPSSQTPSFIKPHFQNPNHDDPDSKPASKHCSSDSFSSMNSESLQMCTEGLGFESSFDETDGADFKWDEKCRDDEHPTDDGKVVVDDQRGKMRRGVREFPPPISCIGRGGKPRVWFEKTKEDGRFVIWEVRAPAQEFLSASRENGRLRMRLVQPEEGEDEFPGVGEKEESGGCREGEGEVASRSEMYDKDIDDS
ncbi:hypothetical protein Droror1_Dr00004092 [Drosera rotundifolia]